MSNFAFPDMILCRDIRTCERCKEPTFWMRPKQRSLGHCVNHSYGGDVTPVQALTLLATTFPGTTVVPSGGPRRYRRGEYVTAWVRRRLPIVTYHDDGRPPERYVVRGWGLPEDAGPCARCGALIRAYGPDAYPLCFECDEKRRRERESS